MGNSLLEELQKYECAYQQALNKAPERRHFAAGPLYTPQDLAENRYEQDLGFPGAFPYTRGVQPTMYRSRLWTMRMYAGFGTAEESNARYRYLIDNGATGLSCAFDLPTQIGYDSDDPMSEGEVGKVGVAIDTLADMEILFDHIDLSAVSTSMTINAPAAILLAMYIAVAEKQGVAPAMLRGTIQNDILKEYSARGTYIFPPKPSMRLITDLFAYCPKHVPKWNTISISGYHIREAGATAVQEIAFTLADGIAYVEAALKAGMDVDEFAGRLSFFWCAHNDFFEEIAKFRAARRLWARLMRDRFGAKKDKSMKMRFHTQTAGSMLTAQQPDNNIVRVALQAAAAVLGGTQSLHTNSKDEALALPAEGSVRTALRTQQVIAYESGLADVIDPLGGSYYLEALTDKIEKEALAYIEKIDALGGAVEAVEQGYIQREIQKSAYEWQMAVEKKKKIIVGVNAYEEEKEPVPGLLHINPAIEAMQKQKLADVKARRCQRAVEQSLAHLEEAARRESENLMPYILEAVRAYATLGEMCQVLRRVFGEYQARTVI